ncbi:hypothetical protein TNCV_2120281 [Trichonephila clavipes]|nr:hypothetical protein TNCV_2120281 [Trichonephila clavipes]
MPSWIQYHSTSAEWLIECLLPAGKLKLSFFPNHFLFHIFKAGNSVNSLILLTNSRRVSRPLILKNFHHIGCLHRSHRSHILLLLPVHQSRSSLAIQASPLQGPNTFRYGMEERFAFHFPKRCQAFFHLTHSTDFKILTSNKLTYFSSTRTQMNDSTETLSKTSS